MANRPEKALQSKCIELLKAHQIYHVNLNSNGWGLKGDPDILACIKGRFVAFELKVGDNQMQDDQKVKRLRILQSGGGHYCPRTVLEFEKILESYLEKEEV